MAYAPSQGRGRDRVVTVGEKVSYNGREYYLASLGGGSHQYAALKDSAGYTYNVDTMDLN